MIGRDRSCFHRSDKAGTIFQGKLIRVSLTPQPDVSGSIVRYSKFGFDYDKEYEEAVTSLTKEGIKEAARRLYESGNFIEFAQMPGKTTE